MNLKRKGFQLLNIKQKDSGQVEWTVGFFSLFILIVLLFTQLQLASWRTSSLCLEDALAASNLASALIDVVEYGRTHKVVIPDPSMAYGVYCEAVKDNLQLDDNWICKNKSVISGSVEVVDYIIYNVDRNVVRAYRVGKQGVVLETWNGTKGVLKAPDGTPVERTGVYSEIAFPVRSFPGIEIQAHKGKLADVWSEHN